MPGSHSKKIRKGYAVGGTADTRLSDIRKSYSKNDPSKVARGPEVSGVPKHFGLGKHRVDLAYITPDEAKLLENLDMHGTTPPNTGPEIQNIPNYNGWGRGDSFGSTANTDPSSGTGNTTGSGDSNTGNGGFNDAAGAAHDANVESYNEGLAEREKERERQRLLDQGYIKTNWNLDDEENLLAGYQYNELAAARAGLTEDEAYAGALGALGYNPDGTPISTTLGTSEDLGISSDLGLSSLNESLSLSNIGYDPENLSLANVGYDPEPTDYAALADTVGMTAADLSLPDFGSLNAKEKTNMEKLSDAITNAGYNAYNANLEAYGQKPVTMAQYKAITTDFGDLAGLAVDGFGNTLTGLQTDTMSTLGDLSLTAGDLASVGYGGLPSISPTMSALQGGFNLFNQTPAITNSYNNLNVPADFNVQDHLKKDKYGNVVQSFTSRIMGPFTKEPELADYSDLGEFMKDKQAYQDKINASANLDFDSYSKIKGVTFKDPKIAANLTKEQYAVAVANDMFADPGLAAAYRSQAEVDKAKEKEATRGGNLSATTENAAEAAQDLTILSENGLDVYNQMLSSGYDMDYAYRYALRV